MQTLINDVNNYCINNKMILSQSKSKIMLCNTSSKYDVIPEVMMNGDTLEFVHELKIVGYIFRSDLRTCSNTEYIVQRSYKQMWIVRRLKIMDATTAEMLKIFRSYLY